MATPSRLTVTITDPDGLVTFHVTAHPMRLVHALPFFGAWSDLFSAGRGFVEGPAAHIYTVVTP